MLLEFYIIVFAENFPPFQEYFFTLFFAFINNGAVYFTGKAGCSGNKPFFILLDKFPVNTGFVIITVYETEMSKVWRCFYIRVGFFARSNWW